MKYCILDNYFKRLLNKEDTEMIFTNTSPLRNVFKLVSLSSYAIKIIFLCVAKTAQFELEFSARVRV